MTDTTAAQRGPRLCTVFCNDRMLAQGRLGEVALAVHALMSENSAASILTFDDSSGAVIDLDLRGSAADVLARLGEEPTAPVEPSRLRGRPKLGVVAREVTLLPRHWDWLSTQPGGASNALRRLVEDARRRDGGQSHARLAREAGYRFMSAMAGDRPGFEEASRALFAGDEARFLTEAASWPADIREHVRKLVWHGIEPASSTATA